MAETLTPGMVNLLREPAYAQIATVNKDGSPQITQVWVDTDGRNILVNTNTWRQKTKNVQRDKRVSINVFDPKNPYRIITARGKVIDVTRQGADELIDNLAKKYLSEDKYPWRKPGEERVTLTIQPEKIVQAQGLD